MKCSVADCSRPSRSLGLCNIHYHRQRRWGNPLRVARRTGRPHNPIESRFWSRVDFSNPDSCWLWTGSRRHEYGEIFRNGKKEYAHRVAYQLVYGELAPGQKVCHTCDTPLCMRPDHLFKGTQGDNIRDAALKDRLRNGSTGPLPGPRWERRNQRRRERSAS